MKIINMLSKKVIALSLMLTLVLGSFVYDFNNVYAYVDSLGNVTNVSVSGDTLTLTVDNGAESGDDILVVQVCDDNIVRFDYRPNGVAESDNTPMLDPNKTWSSVGATITTNTNPITIEANDMTIEIAKTPCRVTIKDSTGTSLLWESSSGGVFYDGIKFLHNTSDNLYGIRGYDFTESNGDILRNDSTHPAHAGQQGDSGGPFIWSSAGYGVLVDSDGGVSLYK